MSVPFHLGFPVHDLGAARAFYGGLLGCREGRRSAHSCVFDFHGNQIVAHLVKGYRGAAAGTNEVDQHQVPVPHFGLVLPVADWTALAHRLQGHVDWIIAPTVRYKGTSGEQHTMFFRDPSGNALEVKAFADAEGMFAPWGTQDARP